MARLRPESAVLKQITDYLDLKHVWWMRIQPFNGRTESGHWMRCARVGCADLLCWIDGKMLWVEVKAPKGRQTQAQEEFQQVVEEHGQHYVVAHSLDDIEAFLRKDGPLPPSRG